MSISELKKQTEALNFNEQGELAAYIIQLRNRQDSEYMSEIQRRIEDKNSEHWLTPAEFETRLNDS